MTKAIIVHHASGQTGEFIAGLPHTGHTGRLTYVRRGKVLVADHTIVPQVMRGCGVAAQLVEALIVYARGEGVTIDPQCSYVAAAFVRHPEWENLRA